MNEQEEAIRLMPGMSKWIVSTEEELDSLPAGSVVLSDAYRYRIHGWPVAFQRWDDGLWHRGARSGSTHPDNFLPATVLHIEGCRG